MSTNPDLESSVPGEVMTFLQEFSAAVNAGDTQSIHTLYENRFFQLTGQFYSRFSQKHQPFHAWPQLLHVQSALEGDQVKTLYRFMHYRSAFLDRGVKAETSRGSWDAYDALFEAIVKNQFIDLPNVVLWDVFDEFQFQLSTVHQRGHKMREGQWNITDSMTRLEKVVKTSDLEANLKRVESGEMTAEQFNMPGPGHALRCAGLYAFIALMRIDLMLGDYYGVVRRCGTLVTNPLTAALTRRVPVAHVPLFYTLGFAYMMMRRYLDASRALRSALRVRAYHRTFVDQLQAQCVMLINVTNVLGNIPMEDLSSFLNDNNKAVVEEDAQLLAKGDTERFREVFQRSSPKFLMIRSNAPQAVAAAAANPANGPAVASSEAREQQERVFMREVSQQIDNIKLRGYFRVYSAMTAEKVGALLHPETPTEFQVAALLSAKHKSRQLTNGNKGAALNGEFKTVASTDFMVVENSVNVVSRAEATRVPITHELVARVTNLNERLARFL